MYLEVKDLKKKLRRGRRLCAGIERDHCRSGKR